MFKLVFIILNNKLTQINDNFMNYIIMLLLILIYSFVKYLNI